MKKDSFLKGAMIATICIVLSKILGIIYVIPFHAIIGTNGRSLYGYAYNMYTLFLNFSTLGIPLAVSKMVSEYNSLGYNNAKDRVYKIALKILIGIAIVSTTILLVFAPLIARTIIGNLTGGNTVEDITFVIRVSSSAIIFVSILSCVRGYLQGHKYITPSSKSEIIEQFVRVVVIIAGSFIAIRLWGTKEAVGIAVFGATVGAIFALIYLSGKIRSIRTKDNVIVDEKENKISDKAILKKLVKYAIPFIIASLVVAINNNIDMLTIVRSLHKYGLINTSDAESILSVITTWGAKLNSIVNAIASGVVVSVLPNITGDYVKKDLTSVRDKINKTLQIVLFFVVPMVIGLSFLSRPVWNVFYGYNELNVSVFKYSIFTALFFSVFLNIQTIMQSLNRLKVANISIAVVLSIKLFLNIPMIILFSKIDCIPVYYASITVTILAYIIGLIICIRDIKKTTEVSFSETLKSLVIIFGSVFVMLFALLLLNRFVPLAGGKLYSLFVIALYATIGASIYFGLMTKFGVFKKIFGYGPFELIKKRIKRK